MCPEGQSPKDIKSDLVGHFTLLVDSINRTSSIPPFPGPPCHWKGSRVSILPVVDRNLGPDRLRFDVEKGETVRLVVIPPPLSSFFTFGQETGGRWVPRPVRASFVSRRRPPRL